MQAREYKPILPLTTKYLPPPPLPPTQPHVEKEKHIYKKGEHKYIWQFVKDLLSVGDPCIQWKDAQRGVFQVHDQVRLAAMWASYRDLTELPIIDPNIGIYRQIKTFLYPPKCRTPFVKRISGKTFQFEQKFFKTFASYKNKSEIHPSELVKCIKTRMTDENFCKDIAELGSKFFCQKGCGSEYSKLESCQNHESVCTYKNNSNTNEAIPIILNNSREKLLLEFSPEPQADICIDTWSLDYT